MGAELSTLSVRRRSFLALLASAEGRGLVSGLGARGIWAQGSVPAIDSSDRMRPATPFGVASGHITAH
jgi:phosphodiesterase/alkaline phosphatase D-like protein